MALILSATCPELLHPSSIGLSTWGFHPGSTMVLGRDLNLISHEGKVMSAGAALSNLS